MFQYLLNFRLNLYRVVTIETMDSLSTVFSLDHPVQGFWKKGINQI